jgi:hypothetical protein
LLLVPCFASQSFSEGLLLALQAKALAKACLVKSIQLQSTAFIPRKQTLPDNFIRLINAGVHEEMLSGIPKHRNRYCAKGGFENTLCFYQLP